MNPKKLIPLVVIFIVLAVSYLASQWHQGRKERLAKEAKRLFALKTTDLTEVVLKKGKQEIRLLRRDQAWEITTPLKARTDKAMVDSLLAALASLEMNRDLGEQNNLEPYGLTNPPFLVEFTAQGKKRRLAVGHKTPGDRSYYVVRDQESHLFTISSYHKDSLDRSVTALRDKILFQFSNNQVKALKVTIGPLTAELQKTDLTWRWQGRQNFKVRQDRLESLLRQLTMSRIRDFVNEHPKDLRPYGLAPKPSAEIIVLLPPGRQRLVLGAKKGNSYYAQQDAQGPVVLVEQELLQKVKQSLASLQDRRFWTGEASSITRLSWGPPGKTWTATRDKDYFTLIGPDKQEFRQPAVRLEVALLKFQELEQERLLPPPTTPSEPQFLLEFSDKTGRLTGRLAELGQTPTGQVTLLWRQGDQTTCAAVARAPYEQLRQDLERLTQPPERK